MAVEIIPFGNTLDGREVHKIILKSGRLEAELMTLGCTILSLRVPDKYGKLVDVVLGFNTAVDYEKNDGYLGMLVGRYANRIAGARFCIDGVRYELEKNEGENQLHGGTGGFSFKVYDVRQLGDSSVEFYQSAADGENGFPGEMKLKVTYTLSDNGLAIRYQAVCDKPTVCNFTNHSYFNLNGGGDGMSQRLWIDADEYTPVNSESIPVAHGTPVDGTPFDFRTEKALSRDINSTHEQLALGCGYDHNYVFRSKKGIRLAAKLAGDKTGIVMETWTNKPGMQVYTANHLYASEGTKNGEAYNRRGAVCLETQFPPNSPNNQDWCPVVLRPGQEYDYTTEYRFSSM